MTEKKIKSTKIIFTTLILSVLSACTTNGNTPKHSSNNHQTTLTSYKTNVQSTPNEKRKTDSIYTCDYVCDSLTTGGMVEWAVNMRKKDKLKIENLTTKILKLSDGKTLTAIQSEIKAWNKLCKSLDETTAQILKMKWWFGGSLGSVYKADVPMEIYFIRPCIEDDYNLLNKNTENNDTQSSNTAANTSLTGISHSIDSAIAFVSPNNIDTSYFEYKYYGNLEEYEQSFIQCKQYAAQLKGRLKEWLDTRKTVMSTLSKNKKAEYNNHTNKALNTIAKTINECIAK